MPTSDTFTQRGVTMTLVAPAEYGFFANGEYQIELPFTIATITPDFSLGAGAQINSMPYGTQGLRDHVNYPTYSAAANVKENLPWLVDEECTIIIAAPVDYGITKAEFSTGVFFTAVTAIRPAGSFRPPYAGTDKSMGYTEDDMTGFVFPGLTLLDPDHEPDLDWLLDATLHPVMEHCLSHEANQQFKWKSDSYPYRTYGLELAGISAGAIARLMISVEDEDPVKIKRLKIQMVQWGIDNSALVDNGMGWLGSGGQHNGRKLPVLFAGKLLGDSHMLGNLNPAVATYSEDTQQAFVTQEIIDLTQARYDGGSTAYPPFGPEHLGTAQFFFDYPLNPSASPDPNASGYYYVTGGQNVLTAMSAIMLGGRSDWGNEAFFQHILGTFWVEAGYTGSGTLPSYGNSVQEIAEDFWSILGDEYFSDPTLQAPSFNLAARPFDVDKSLVLTAPAGTIYYEMGATPADPTAASTEYTAPIALTTSTVVKAIAIEDGFPDSPVAEYTFVRVPIAPPFNFTAAARAE